MTVFLDTPVDKSLSSTGTWLDIDLSSNIPVGATGVIFQVRNLGGNDYYYGLRKKGSGDARNYYISDGGHYFCVIGVDANRKCQGRISNTNVDFHLVGYTEVDATLFTNAYNKSQSTLGAWTDLDLSSELPAGAVAAIFEVVNTHADNSRSWGLQKKGSDDNRYNDLPAITHLWFIVGVDANRKCEFKIESVNIDFFLIGYLSSGSAETNGIDRSLGSTGTYTEITESSAPSGATGVFVECISTSDIYSYAARKNGISWDKYDEIGAKKAGIFVGLDANKKWEGKISNIGVDFYTLGYFSPGVETKTKTSSLGLAVEETFTKTSSLGLRIVTQNTKESSLGLNIFGTETKESSLGLAVEETFTKTSSLGLRIVTQNTKESSLGLNIFGTETKESSLGLAISETKTKTSSLGLRIVTQNTKESSLGLAVEETLTKTSSLGLAIVTQNIKTSSLGLAISETKTKTSSLGLRIVTQNTKTSSLGLFIVEQAEDRGFYYAKLGSTILTSLEKDSFRITEELNKIPSFEFEISNCTDNRTAITTGITDILTIYRRLDSTDTLMFTGRIDVDAIEYLSLERIRIPGYASYIDLNFRFHQHLNSEDAEDVGKVFDYSGSYTDYTTAANNDTINDVLLTLDSVGDIVYIGQGEQFFGAQVKYSTKGVQAESTSVVFEYSKGSSVWSTLDVLDETRAFTEDPGTYYITIPHKPSDWAKETVNSVKKFWIRARVTAGSYTTSPKLDRIKITNVDVCRVYYFDTAANSIMDDVLDGTGYSMDGTDVCPSDTISMVGEYETKLRFIAGVANALTWDDSGDKKAFQWWVDTSKKVHFKQERGTTRDNITQDLVILNNVVDYFNLSNRLRFFGNYDGINQLRAIIEDTTSQDTHGIRELAVPEERHNNYISLKEAAQKAMTHTKAPLQKIPATLPTTKWLANNLEVGDTVTIHQPRWNIDEQALQIVRADIGPSTTKLDIGISQEHLDGLKASLQRRLDITGIRMHGSTSVFQIGPVNENYQRIDNTTVYPARLKFEIPSDARYIHRVLLSWKIGSYRADSTGGSGDGHDHGGYGGSGGAHDHDGYAGSGGAFTPDVLNGGAHTPVALAAGAHDHDVALDTNLVLSQDDGYLPYSKYVSYESSHTHSNPDTGYEGGHIHSVGSTGGPSSTVSVMSSYYSGTACASGTCINGGAFSSVASTSHTHTNPNTGVDGGHDHSIGDTGGGTSHRHTISTHAEIRQYLTDVHLSVGSSATEPAHNTPINAVSAHPHTGVAESAHGDHTIDTESGHTDHTITTDPGADVELEYGIKEIEAGTIMMLIVNGETVASNYDGDQTNIVITGYANTGSNTIELQPAVGQNHKGSASQVGTCTCFIEAKKW